MCVPPPNPHTQLEIAILIQMKKKREQTAEQKNRDTKREAINAHRRPLRSLGPKANMVRSSFLASGRGPGGGSGKEGAGQPLGTDWRSDLALHSSTGTLRRPRTCARKHRGGCQKPHLKAAAPQGLLQGHPRENEHAVKTHKTNHSAAAKISHSDTHKHESASKIIVYKKKKP